MCIVLLSVELLRENLDYLENNSQVLECKNLPKNMPKMLLVAFFSRF